MFKPMDESDDLRPWVPPGVRPFKIGDRVRVRLSGECRLPQNVTTHGYVEHYPEQNGMEGVVIDNVGWPSADPAHTYLVKLPPVDFGSWGVGGGTFAAIELELVERKQ